MYIYSALLQFSCDRKVKNSKYILLFRVSDQYTTRRLNRANQIIKPTYCHLKYKNKNTDNEVVGKYLERKYIE